MRTENSRKLLSQALDVIPGGTNSVARAAATLGKYEGIALQYPSFMSKGKGSRIWDADGNEYVDYHLAFGPMILGHAHPGVREAIVKQLEKGLLFGMNTESEIVLSRKIADHVPCAEQVSLLNTGSCAASGAIRVARAHTGKQKIIKFEGHYHGWHDWAMVEMAYNTVGAGVKAGHKSSKGEGIPKGVLEDVIVLPYNDPDPVERAVKRQGNEIAALIVEPYQSNNGVICPRKGYLDFLRKITEQNEIVLIFDEVITGFRLGLGGAQEAFGVTPDLATFGKAIANGVPLSAVVGKKRYMQPIADSKIFLAGTYNANPVSTAAAIATMSELERPGTYERLRKIGKKIMKGIGDAAVDSSVEVLVQGPGPFWGTCFTDREEITNVRQIMEIPFHPHIRRSAVFFQELVKHGVFGIPARNGRMYVSTAHSQEDADETIQASYEAFKEASKIR